MTIALVTSSLEPGKDGVGDHVRLLAAELLARGCSGRLLALHDVSTTAVLDAPAEFSGGSLPMLRLPATLAWRERERLAGRFLAVARPAWFSLHFVAYGWQRRGIAAGWGGRFDRLAGPARRHLMLHETWTWLGACAGAPFRLRLLAVVQRACIVAILRRYRPELLHTHTPVYATMLEELGSRAELLPLFGNVPIAPVRDDAWLFEELRRHGLALAEETRARVWLAGFFATLYPEWEPEPLFSILAAAARAAGRRVCLVSVGLMRGGEARWESFRAKYPDFTFVNLGALPPGRVSQVLQALDFGVATTPWTLITKSGAAAAMLEHGLPVIVSRDDWRRPHGPTPGPPPHPQLILAGPALERQLLAGLPKAAPRARVGDVAAQLLAAFAGA